jgi:hypothetical protein
LLTLAIGRRKALELQPTKQAQYTSYRWQDTETEIARLTPQGQYVLNALISTLGGTQSGVHPITNGTATFPLSTDHLIPLIQLNVLRATLTNMSLLSILHEVPLECGTPLLPLHPTPSNIPASLAPTALQKSTPHAHWIDIIPSPTMRDNCIRWADTIDEDDICSDFIGGLYEGNADSDTKGWIVWKDPWDISGWEVTEGFVKKWGRLLRGCQDIIEASNRWRAIRGEDPLVVEA